MNELKTDIPVTGMTCAACANRIEKGLQRIDGVTLANVNFASEKAVVSFESDKTDLHTIQDKIRSLGFDILEETAEFQISGMTCAACSTRIEKGLSRMDGVHSANINLALETGNVGYDPTILNADDFIKKIRALGYDAELKGVIPKGQEDHRQVEIRNKTRMFYISAALSLPLLWTMFSHFSFTSWMYVPDFLMDPYNQWALATPVQLAIGWTFYRGAYFALRNKSANMDVLVALGTSAAYFYSVYLVLSGSPHGLYFRNECGANHLDHTR